MFAIDLHGRLSCSAGLIARFACAKKALSTGAARRPDAQAAPFGIAVAISTHHDLS
jgi:hypothetical protein